MTVPNERVMDLLKTADELSILNIGLKYETETKKYKHTFI